MSGLYDAVRAHEAMGRIVALQMLLSPEIIGLLRHWLQKEPGAYPELLSSLIERLRQCQEDPP